VNAAAGGWVRVTRLPSTCDAASSTIITPIRCYPQILAFVKPRARRATTSATNVQVSAPRIRFPLPTSGPITRAIRM
jgi:hypothetical protein